MWSSALSNQTADIKNIRNIKHSTEDEKKIKNIESFEWTKEDKSPDMGDSTTEKKGRDPRIPDWLPEKDDVVVIEPVERPPHLRSKVTVYH